MDGFDLSSALFESEASPRNVMVYYIGTRVFAIRKGAYKAHFYTQSAYGVAPEEKHDPPLLYNLEHDPSEKFDIAAGNPEIIADLKQELEKHNRGVKRAENQMIKWIRPGE